MKDNKIKSLSAAIGHPILKIVVGFFLVIAILAMGVIIGAALRSNAFKAQELVENLTEETKEAMEKKGEEKTSLSKVHYGDVIYGYENRALQIDWSDKSKPNQIEMSDRLVRAIALSRLKNQGYEGVMEMTPDELKALSDKQKNNLLSEEDLQKEIKEFKKEDNHKRVFVVGQVTNGTYKDYNLVIIAYEDEFGIGSTTDEVYALTESGKLYAALGEYGRPTSFISVEKESAYDTLGETISEVLGDTLTYEHNLTIPDLDIQPILTDDHGNTFQLSRELSLNESLTSQLKNTGRVTTQNGTDLQNDGAMFVYVSPDKRLARYDLVVPFWAKPSGAALDQVVYAPKIIWNDGSASITSYIKARSGGCGWSYPVYIDEEIKEKDLIKTGNVKGHDGKSHDIYELKWDFDELHVKGSQSGYLQNYAGFSYQQPDYERGAVDKNPKKYFDAFVASHPMLFWKDSYDRWVRFEHVDAVIPAECGKPVIYLYPEETTDMTVEVAPLGGFTFTEPVYNDGWRVTAHPDGRVVNRDDGQEYPYLFWEGRGGMYVAPENFWVVDRGDVETFLVETLSKVGLNETEISDFNEFWLPRMQDAPHYKIGFHGTRVMDALAPLTISEKPDSIFRILMDFEELSEPIQENPPRNLRPFERNGFTVVEWGGVIK